MEQQIPVAALQTMNVQLSLNDMQVFVAVYAESDRHFWFEFKKKKTTKIQTKKQVAQRATIAHLSPMCQGQISFKKTYKWAMETRGRNSTELLCLSWLPATLINKPERKVIKNLNSFQIREQLFFRA